MDKDKRLSVTMTADNWLDLLEAFLLFMDDIEANRDFAIEQKKIYLYELKTVLHNIQKQICEKRIDEKGREKYYFMGTTVNFEG